MKTGSPALQESTAASQTDEYSPGTGNQTGGHGRPSAAEAHAAQPSAVGRQAAFESNLAEQGGGRGSPEREQHERAEVRDSEVCREYGAQAGGRRGCPGSRQRSGSHTRDPGLPPGGCEEPWRHEKDMGRHAFLHRNYGSNVENELGTGAGWEDKLASR